MSLENDGLKCEGDSLETSSCQMKDCIPTDGEWSQWSRWSGWKLKNE